MTKVKIKQNALIQSEVFEQPITLLGDTSEDVDIEIEENHRIKLNLQRMK